MTFDDRLIFGAIDIPLDSHNLIELLATLWVAYAVTVFSFIWSWKRMTVSLHQRRAVHSDQVKAMWRVDQTNFNRKFSANDSTAATSTEQQMILKRVLSLLN